MRIDGRSSLNLTRGFLARGARFGAVAIDDWPGQYVRKGKDIEELRT